MTVVLFVIRNRLELSAAVTNVPLHIPDPLSTTRAAISSSSDMLLLFAFVDNRGGGRQVSKLEFYDGNDRFFSRSRVASTDLPSSSKIIGSST